VKTGGENSLSEKQGILEGVEGMVLQDPCDKAKAGLPEAQSPAVEHHTHGGQRLGSRAIESESSEICDS
jgi:hypothetical protein